MTVLYYESSTTKRYFYNPILVDGDLERSMELARQYLDVVVAPIASGVGICIRKEVGPLGRM